MILLTQLLQTFINRLVIRIVMDGLASCAVFQVFVRWWSRTTRPLSNAIFISLPNKVCRAIYGWLRTLVHLHCDAPQRMICRELTHTCIVTSWSGRQQSKHGDVADLSKATLHVYGRKFGIKSLCKRAKKYVNLKRKVGLSNAFYLFITLQSSKLRFYPKCGSFGNVICH